MSWRPEGWENPNTQVIKNTRETIKPGKFLTEHEQSFFRDYELCEEAYEAGADAMLERLRNKYSRIALDEELIRDALTFKSGVWVFIPDEEVVHAHR